MIPLKLTLNNFLCYRDDVVLDLTGIQTACLAGQNGHGKSALLDALTWVLWGKARETSDDDLIHMGQSEMRVELEFDLEGQRYRVTRRRARPKTAGGGGSTDVGFAVLEEDGTYRAITGRGVRDTGRLIEQTLGMSYKLFTNSAYLRQGRADEFTMADPADRKDILGEILDLSKYDKLEEQAKEAVKQTRGQIDRVQAEIDRLSLIAEKRPEFWEQLTATRKQQIELEDGVKSLMVKLQELQRRQQEVACHRQEQAKLQTELDALNRKLGDERTALARVLAGYQRSDELFARADAIEQNYLCFQTYSRQDKAEAERERRYHKLQGRQKDLRHAISLARTRLEGQRDAARDHIERSRQAASGLAEREAALAQLDQEQAQLARQQAEHQARAEELRRWQAERDELDGANQQREAEAKRLKARIDKLPAAGAPCPLCARQMGAHDRAQVVREFEQDLQKRRAEWRECQVRSKELSARVQAAEPEVEQLGERLREDSLRLARQRSALEAQLDQARRAGQELRQAEETLCLTERRLAEQDFAAAERTELAEVERQLVDLAYDAAAHEQLRAALQPLEKADEEYHLLEKARTWRVGADRERELLERNVAQFEQQQTAAQTRLAVLRAELGGTEVLDGDIAQTSATLDRATKAAQRAREDETILLSRIGDCERAEQDRDARQKALLQAKEELGLYNDLVLAFGKKGVQAMIIETVLPELEQMANEILARMTDNRMHVTLESQKLLAKGTTSETLEIKIADELGTRAYELYSGGEAFRVNFALRVALSKLLARRAGKQLQTLIIDEGFGTQDSSGREKLVDSIQAIQEDFNLILVITHIDELKDQFPVRIDVVKTDAGSQVSVA